MHRPGALLVATDFSEPARAALDSAIDLALALPAALHIAHALVPATPMLSATDFGVPEAERQRAARTAEEALAACAAEAAARDVLAQTHLLQGPVEGALGDLARQIGCDWVVVGTHGHTGLKHTLLGSVAERIVRHAPCSVLVARAASPPATAH